MFLSKSYLKKFLIMVRRFPLVGVVGVVAVLVVLVGGVDSPIDNFNPLILNKKIYYIVFAHLYETNFSVYNF